MFTYCLASFHRWLSSFQKTNRADWSRRRRLERPRSAQGLAADVMLLEPRCLLSATPQFLDPNPANGNGFGSTVVPLSTGNVVITSPNDSTFGTGSGAVYLFNGQTGALISSLVGTHPGDHIGSAGVTALPNGNYLVDSPNWNNLAGAVTFGNGFTGVAGIVNSSNSLVGGSGADRVGTNGVTVLTNGNYVVDSPFWGLGKGAVTWGSGVTGITGAVSSSNSLVGRYAGLFTDNVGSSGVTALTNGNYVVVSESWYNDAANTVGAVTFGNGLTGITGIVSASNSLVGSTLHDQVGADGVTALTNGNYVVNSHYWHNGAATSAGAVTFGSGVTGIAGVVSSSNSLVGSTANDQVGLSKVTALTNGNYVVDSYNWSNGAATNAGAVTFGSGVTGISGVVSSSNSLVGSTRNDEVGVGGVTALTNGNYVVDSWPWSGRGAVTFGNGVTGIAGAVSSSNSLVGGTSADFVGHGGVTALTNGNYVVDSELWSNGAATFAGAVTFGSGVTGITGFVSSGNSLVGTTLGDGVGFNGVTALTNGNYVVDSSGWNNGAATKAGAVTFGSGVTGIKGAVSSSNSLVGSTANDQVGLGEVTALTNGNYVVDSSAWNNGAATVAGAVTFGSGVTGITGAVSASNSLIGDQSGDRVGNLGVTALTNGNYVVDSSGWNNESFGAVTFGSGVTGITGIVSSSNSLVGGKRDSVGAGGITALTNGNYVVDSYYWSNGVTNNVGAVTFGSGVTGITGVVSSSNSLVGDSSSDLVGNGGIKALNDGNFIVISSSWGNGPIANAGAVTFGSGVSGITGVVSPTNSLVGQTANELSSATFVLDNANNNFDVSFASDGSGHVFIGSTPYGLFYHIDAQQRLWYGAFIIDTNVAKFGFANNGDLVDLNFAGQLKEETADGLGNWSVVDTNVTDFLVQGVGSSGDLVSLRGDGTLGAQFVNRGSFLQIDSGVTSIGVDGNGDVVDLHGNGGLFYLTAPGASWTQIAGNTSSIQVGSDGTVYALLPYGSLYTWKRAGGFSFVTSNVSSYQLDANGTAYILKPGGNLSIWKNGALSPLKSNVSSFQVAPNGTVDAQLPYGVLSSWPGSGTLWTTVASNVSSYQVASNGNIYLLQPGGVLSVDHDGRLTQLQTNVSSFDLAPNGTVYAQLPYGALQSWSPGGSWSLVAANVSSFQIGPNGSLYVLQPGGNLSVVTNGSLTTVQSNVSSFQMASNGLIYALLPYGALDSWAGPGSLWTTLQSNVSSFQVASNGMLYVLQPGGNLNLWTFGSWALLAANTNSFQFGSDGTLYDMLPHGGLYQWTGFGGIWSAIGGNISSFQVAPNGTLYVLQAGNLDLWANGSLNLFAAGTSSFQVGPDGTLYLVFSGNSLYSWTFSGTSWTFLASNITSYQVSANGTLFALQSGNLEIRENGSWSLLAANTSSFQLGPNGTVYLVLPGNALYSWSGFGGTWTGLQSGISSFQVAPNGMVYALQGTNLSIWENGSWALLAANSSSFQIGPDGMVYVLLPGKALYKWSGFGGTWTSVAGGVNSYQVLANGEIFVNGSLIN